jgi:putative Mg2+ transporter-C (MgtC) family protein
MPITDLELTKRLVLAALLGGVLGLEREWHHKAAGLRTNILIAIGSALFTLMSIDLAAVNGQGDPTRIASQIVTGIGFLGAGAIMRNNASVQGLTTAAAIWVNAAIGVACGGGEYHLAFIATGVTLVVLVTLPWLERAVYRLNPPPKNDSPTPIITPPTES